MAKQMKALQQVLLKLQTTFGTEETPLINTDAAEVMDGAKIGFDPAVAAIKLLGAGFGQSKSVVGPSVGDITITYPLRTGGAAGSYGQWTKPLQASGFVESVLSNVATYTLTSDQSAYKDCTIWAYSGSKTASTSLKRILFNCMFNAKFTLDFKAEENFGKVEFTGKGVYKGSPSTASQVVVTPATAVIQPLKGAVISFFSDSDFDLLSLEFDVANEILVPLEPSGAYGLGQALIKNRATKWRATVYRDSDANAETIYEAGTLGTISAAWGTAPNKITLATGASKAQITEVTDGDNDGAETMELAGIVVDNSFTVAVDTTV